MPRAKKVRYPKNKPHPGICIGVVLLIVADLVYLFKLSNEALFDTPLGTGNHLSPHSMFFSRNKLLNIVQRKKSTPKTNDKYYNAPTESAKKNPKKAEANGHTTLTAEQWNLIQIAKDRGLRNVDDRGPILEILVQAGLDLRKEGDLDQETVDQLPTWTQVQDLYGKKPRIVGLERCEEFRNSVEPSTRFLAMAGTFNTGTNLIHAVMKHNCQINERMEAYGSKSKGIRWQGRHSFEDKRTRWHG